VYARPCPAADAAAAVAAADAVTAVGTGDWIRPTDSARRSADAGFCCGSACPFDPNHRQSEAPLDGLVNPTEEESDDNRSLRGKEDDETKLFNPSVLTVNIIVAVEWFWLGMQFQPKDF
jgi:hypothetical protein